MTLPHGSQIGRSVAHRGEIPRRDIATAPDWIPVPGGIFHLGGGKAQAENPRHLVRLEPFLLARTPVVHEDYETFLRSSDHEAPPEFRDPRFDHPRKPVVGISWHDAIAYCSWLGESIGCAVRLPTEAEWERAATADRGGILYPWGDAPPESLPDYGDRWLDGPEPVDLYPSSHPWGFLGLGENVHEWCSDWYDSDYYRVCPASDPRGPATGRRRASRGGSWRHAVKGTRCTARSSIPPDRHYLDYGMRLAADNPERP